MDDLEGELEDIVIVRDESLVTCDNKECKYRGEIFWCYLNQEKRCPFYLDYINKER